MREETVALNAVLKTGNLDLYKRAQQINEKQARAIVSYRQGHPNLDTDFDMMEVSDDEPVNRPVKKSGVKDQPAYNRKESFFSEKSEVIKKDEVKKWQKESYQIRFNEGGFLSPIENEIMNSGF